MDTEIVVVLTASYEPDPYSEELVQSWEWSPEEREVRTIAPAEPRPSQEPAQDARNAVTSGWTLYLPAGDPISSDNRVRVRGIDYPVQGQPADWLGAGVVVQAFKTEG
jgi:hypothetical protein